MNLLNHVEQAVLDLRALYRAYGYRPYKMSKFEEYDLYVHNKDFLVSDNIITFTDTNGKLMALKPDVTISIIKNFDDQSDSVQKAFYNENVYRTPKDGNGFKEIMQTGIECIGKLTLFNVCEVITLAARSLYAMNPQYILDISHMGLVSSLISEMKLPEESNRILIKCIGQKNIDEIRRYCSAWGVREPLCKALETLISASGEMREVLETIRPIILNDRMKEAVEELQGICDVLQAAGYDGNINFDFSVVNNMNYYNGVVFQGFIEGIPNSVLSGGRYDNLMARIDKKAGAIGFAVYLDQLEMLEIPEENDVDIVLLYDPGDNIVKVLDTVRKLSADGQTVTALTKLPDKLRYGKCVREVQ